jgi:DNA-binding transcriptional LysR family regulator
MNLRQLASFFAVVDELHFGRAATRLFRSQTSVSESVQALEDELGGQLFVRTTRSVRLTEFGERCALRLRPPYEALVAEFHSLSRAPFGSDVTIAHTPGLGQFILPHWVEHMIAHETPEMMGSWISKALHTRQQVDAVLAGEIGIGVCWQPRPAAGLEIVPLATCPFVVMLSADDDLAHRDSIRLSDLRDRPVLVTPAQHNPVADAIVRQAMAAAGLNERQCDDRREYDEIALGVVAGAGVGLQPATLTAINRLPGLVFRRLETELDLGLQICAVRRVGAGDERVGEVTRILAGVVAAAMATIPVELRRH